MRKIAEYTAKNGKKAKVYKDTEWNEYRVKWYNSDGTYMDASDYFTDDKEDAIDTAYFSIQDEDKASK